MGAFLFRLGKDFFIEKQRKIEMNKEKLINQLIKGFPQLFAKKISELQPQTAAKIDILLFPVLREVLTWLYDKNVVFISKNVLNNTKEFSLQELNENIQNQTNKSEDQENINMLDLFWNKLPASFF